MVDLVKFLVTELVDDKAAVNITQEESEIKIIVAKSDMGKVIGKQGRIAKAIRTIVKSVAAKEGIRYNVEIVEVD